MATIRRWYSKMATIFSSVIIDQLHQKALFISFCLPQVLARKIIGRSMTAKEETGMEHMKMSQVLHQIILV